MSHEFLNALGQRSASCTADDLVTFDVVAYGNVGRNYRLAVPPGEGEALAKKHGCLFAATSSKDNNNVVAAFRALCSKVLESQERMESIKEEAIVSLTAGKPRGAKTTGGNCC